MQDAEGKNMVSSSLAHQELLAMDAGSRVEHVESRLVSWIGAARLADARSLEEPTIPPLDSSARLSDLGIDSLQLVDIKFELDELVGKELDVGVFIRNPTIRELAQESLRVCGL
jgi:acyl carrier protein